LKNFRLIRPMGGLNTRHREGGKSGLKEREVSRTEGLRS